MNLDALRSRITELEQDKALLSADMQALTAAIVKHSHYADTWWDIRALVSLATDQADAIHENQQLSAALAETREALQQLQARNAKADRLVEMVLPMVGADLGADDFDHHEYVRAQELAKELGYDV